MVVVPLRDPDPEQTWDKLGALILHGLSQDSGLCGRVVHRAEIRSESSVLPRPKGHCF